MGKTHATVDSEPPAASKRAAMPLPLRVVVSLPCVLIVSLALAAAPTQSVRWTKRHLLTGPYENATVADLNKDGRPDIISGPFVLYGPDFAPQAYRAAVPAADYMHENSVHTYDVDGDGWPDIIAASWDEDGIYWYKNPGDSHAAAKKEWEMQTVE